jgi:hypothetical protein
LHINIPLFSHLFVVTPIKITFFTVKINVSDKEPETADKVKDLIVKYIGYIIGYIFTGQAKI